MKGFSLLETLAAAVILAVVAIAEIQALRQSNATIRSAGRHTLSMLIAQKAADEIQQAALDDVYVDLQLADAGSAGRPLARAGHPAFAALEDSATPYGLLEPDRDLAIEPADKGLWGLYGEARLAQTVDAASTPGVVDVVLRAEAGGAGLDVAAEAFSMSLVAPRRPAPLAALLPDDPAERDAALKRAFFPGGTLTLDQEATRAGTTADAVRDLAPLVLPIRRVLDALAQPAAASDAVAQGREAERRGAWIAQALAAARDANVEPSRFDSAAPVLRRTVRALARRAATFRAELDRQLALAIGAYVGALAGPGIDRRRYRWIAVERRVHELARLRLLMGTTDSTFLTSWVAHREQLRGLRDRPISAHLAQERRLLADRPALDRAHAATRERLDELGQGATRLAALAGLAP